MEDQEKKEIRPPDFDTRCSNACTRAGIAALLLAALAFSLMPTQRSFQKLADLQKYVLLRIDLKDQVEALQKDPFWKDNVPNKETLEQLIAYTLEGNVWTKTDRGFGQRGNGDDPKDPSLPKQTAMGGEEEENRLSINARPKPGWVKLAMPYAAAIARPLKELCDDNFLFSARSFSSEFEKSIRNWQRLRDTTLTKVSKKNNYMLGWLVSDRDRKEEVDYEKSKKGSEWVKFIEKRERLLSREGIEFLKARRGVDYVKAEMQKDVWRLNLEEIQPLSQYEFPNLRYIQTLVNEEGRITVSNFGRSLSIFSASIFIEISLSIIMIYFWLFQREAMYSEAFPAAGTVFSVLARTCFSRFVFFILVAGPPLATGLLAAGFLSSVYREDYGLSAFGLVGTLASIVLLISALIWRDFRGRPVTGSQHISHNSI